MYEQAIEAAVNYWAGFLTSDNAMIDKSGDAAADMFFALLRVSTETPPINESVILKFKDTLGSHIRTLLERDVKWISFGVDYGPDMELSDALATAGFRGRSPFPIKTMMWITPKNVSVRQGYQAAERILWSAETAE